MAAAHRSDTSGTNLGGWLTTVVERVSLDMLRARTSRREDAQRGPRPSADERRRDAPDPGDRPCSPTGSRSRSLVVLDRLKPSERIAFVLHDLFGVAFDEIAPVVGGTTSAAARQLASRARRRVRGVEED